MYYKGEAERQGQGEGSSRRKGEDKGKYNYLKDEEMKEIREKLKLKVPEGERRYQHKSPVSKEGSSESKYRYSDKDFSNLQEPAEARVSAGTPVANRREREQREQRREEILARARQISNSMAATRRMPSSPAEKQTEQGRESLSLQMVSSLIDSEVQRQLKEMMGRQAGEREHEEQRRKEERIRELEERLRSEEGKCDKLLQIVEQFQQLFSFMSQEKSILLTQIEKLRSCSPQKPKSLF